jgi:lycopene cyclase domain-containing protein
MLNYLIIDLLILIPVMLIALKWKFNYYKFIIPLLISIFVVGTSYIIWDIIVTEIGHWSFNDKYLVGIRILGLPLEEILFFVVVPVACLFIYENLNYFLKDSRLYFNPFYYASIALLIIGLGIIYSYQGYTMLALFSVAAFLFIASFVAPEVLRSKLFWLYIIVSFIPFIIFNFLLTSIPIVLYNPIEIWGGHGWWNGRFLTIPLEDFFYNFSMLGFYFLVYIKAKTILIKK